MESAEHVPSRQAGMPYREDCWSDGETSALVDAWGERYLELNRGSLRQKQWQEVADAVNSRVGMTRRKIRTDVQCKNRIDTLKKKYKQEKAKIVEGTALTSQWPYYGRLDVLIGAATLPAGSGSGFGGVRRPSSTKSPSPPLALPLPLHRKGSTPLPAAAPLRIGNKLSALPVATAVPVDDSFIRKAAAAAAAASSSFPVANSFIRKTPPIAPPLSHVDHSFIRKTPPPPPAPPVDNYFIRKAAAAAAAAKREAIEEEEEEESESNSERRSVSSSGGERRGKKRKGGDGIVELARAIDKMGKMYERVEEARQREMMEMEKQRMELIKGLELQRMQMFADLKVQIERIKQSRRLSQAGDLIGSVSAVSFLLNPSFL